VNLALEVDCIQNRVNTRRTMNSAELNLFPLLAAYIYSSRNCQINLSISLHFAFTSDQSESISMSSQIIQAHT
jgi:hypothetical protein